MISLGKQATGQNKRFESQLLLVRQDLLTLMEKLATIGAGF